MKKQFFTQIGWILWILTISISLTSCGVPPLDILEKGIDELAKQPSRWEDTILSIIQQLESSTDNVSKSIAAEVRATYQNILGQTASEFSCRSDFVANRLQQRLSAIGHTYDPNRFKAPEIKPVVCSTNPSDQITVDDKLLVFYGYDFKEFEEENSFEVILRYADNGDIVLSQAGYVAKNTNYQLNVDLQSDTVQNAIRAMDKNRGPQIVLTWGNQNVMDDDGEKSALPVIVPAPVVTPIPPLPASYETAKFSEEDPAQNCMSGFLITGVRCSGDYCDNLRLTCTPYMSGRDETLSTDWRGNQKWISDEKSKNSFLFLQGFIWGMKCKNDYCDEIRPTLMSSSYVVNTKDCRKTPYFSDGDKQPTTCDPGYFVAGLSCKGDYCDDISLTCCRAEITWP